MRSWWRRHPRCLRFLIYRRILLKVIRGTMFVSMLYYSLKLRTKLTIRRSRWNCRMILIKRRIMTLISMTRGSVTGEIFSRTMKEVWMGRHSCMLSVGIYISMRRKNL